MSKGEAKQIYETDTKKVRTGDLTFDWKEYRLAASVSGVSGYDWRAVRARFMKQMDDGDTSGALKSASEIQNHNMAEPEGHLLALVVYQKLGRDQDGAFEHKVVESYLNSITATGDGMSSKTAYVVVDVSEEYFFLNVVMGVGMPTSQALVNERGHSFDKLTVKTRDGKEQEIWFNVDISMNSLKEALK